MQNNETWQYKKVILHNVTIQNTYDIYNGTTDNKS